ncbi:MAG: outer membrane beta-barrel protein [Gracilimonas sp.]|nr:outer membrane beta-barrel protein [Gracilimonas sp.]
MAATSTAYSQFNIQHQAPVLFERGVDNAITFNVPGITQTDFQQAILYYRYDGASSYQQKEVQYNNGFFRTSIYPEANNASTIEYYFEITLNSGVGLFYPNNLPSENPVTVEIVDEAGDQKTQSKEQIEGVDYTILSPDAGTGVSPENVVIAVALFYDMQSLEPGEFRLLIDGQDVTEQADTSAYYISYVPKNLERGRHSIAIEYATDTKTYAVTNWDFSVVAPGQATFQGFQENNIPQGNVELSARNQVIAGDINNAYSGRGRVSGKVGDFRYSAKGFLTSQEDPRLQPQNRYGVNLAYGDIWNFEAGHVYPNMSQFTIAGRRIHGLNTSVHLLNENINMQFMYGELERSITNLYDSLIVEDVVIGADSVVDRNYFLTYKDQGRGNFQRTITGGRLSFGNEEKFQIGFHALKIEDDTTSITNVRDYRDIVNSNLTLNSNLNALEQDSLAANPEDLVVRSGNINPRGNLVAGGDLQFGIDNNRIRFESEAVISALNNNIYDGPLTSQRADDLGFDVDEGITDLLEQLSWLIIVNENMDVLPLNLNEDDGEITAEPFFPTSILAGNGELSFRYPGNSLRIQYRWIGPNFNSLANSTIRRDIAGFTVSDRVNLFSNRLYVTIAYENLQDNVSNTRDATTNTISYRSNISWYPVNRDLPRISASFRYRTRDNGVQRQNYLLSDDLLNAAVRNIQREQRTINGQDTLIAIVTPTPRNNNSLNINSSITQQFRLFNTRNDLSLNISNLKTTDEVFAFGDVLSTSVSVNLTSRFNDAPLETQLGYTYNDTESGSGQSQVLISGFYVGGQLFLWDNTLNINARLAYTNNDSETRNFDVCDSSGCSSDQALNENPNDDYFALADESTSRSFGSYVFQAGARYNITENHALLFDANLTNITNQSVQNDRIVQLRYVYSF